MQKLNWLALLISVVYGRADALNFTKNYNYFNYPPVTDEIPVFHVGDTVNVAFNADNYSTRTLKLWCGNINKPALIQQWQDLPSQQTKSLQVDATWSDPCNFALVYPNSDGTEKAFFLSGVFNVAEKAVNPTTFPTNSDVPVVTTTGSQSLKDKPGFGAGIGVGIFIGLTISGFAGFGLWFFQRRKKTKATAPMPVLHDVKRPIIELENQCRYEVP